MSYIRIIIYSFECDAEGCEVNVDVTPLAGPNLLARALAELRDREGWTTAGGDHLCPKHKETAREE